MLGRYAELKAQLPPGTVLFYQVGTFFETFEEDAKIISQALSIRLTSREAAGEGRVPLAGVPGHVVTFRPYDPGSGMVLDAATRRNLGLDDLIERVDRTSTPMGSRALRRWLERPLLDAGRIRQRIEAVDALAGDFMLREEVREHLGRIPDIERIATRIVRLSASPNDLLSLRGALEEIGPLGETLGAATSRSSLLSRVLGA